MSCIAKFGVEFLQNCTLFLRCSKRVADPSFDRQTFSYARQSFFSSMKIIYCRSLNVLDCVAAWRLYSDAEGA